MAKVELNLGVQEDPKLGTGDVIVGDYGETYLFAQVGFNQHKLISLQSGNRKSDSEKYERGVLLSKIKEDLGAREVKLIKSENITFQIKEA